MQILYEKKWPRFGPHAASKVRSDLIQSPILGGIKQLLFYSTFWLEGSLCPKKPFLNLGIKWALLLGTPIKIWPPYIYPHWKRGAHANFGTDWSKGKHEKWRPWFHPHAASEVRSDLIRSPILGGPVQLLLYATFLFEAILTLFGHFSLLDIKWAPLLGTPIKSLTPLC